MADPIKREDLRWESALASISLAGVRPLVQDSVDLLTTSEEIYTVTDRRTKRLVILRTAGASLDIRFDLNATASATSFPILPSVYFVLEVEYGDALHLYNVNAGSLTVYVLEIR